MPNENGIIDVKEYFMFCVFTQRGPVHGLIVQKNRTEALYELMKNGLIIVNLMPLTMEEYTILTERMQELQKKPNIIIAGPNAIPKS